ncbi:MAG TPA: response regulator [Kofleriaceae bacterium]|jgi:CheY-like chemotaxis protein
MPHHHVLVVDDDRDIRDSLVELLQDQGYQAAGAANGLEALEVMRTGQELPCVILLDLMMPMMDGWEFREAQLKNPAWTQIPVIVISAYGDLDAKARALAVEHLRKPLALRTLMEAVRRHCPS